MIRALTQPILPALIAVIGLSAMSDLTAAETFKIDASHSGALFKAKHLDVAWTYGRFTDIKGTVSVDADGSKNAVSLTIGVASLSTDNENRDKHLKGEDFFDAKQFPTMTFESTAWAKTTAGFDVTGTLTIKGVSKTVTVSVVAVGRGASPFEKGVTIVGFETTFSIKRSDYGVTWNKAPIGDEVPITIGLEANNSPK